LRSKDDILIKLEEINKELKMLKINMNKNKDNPMLYRNQLSNKSVLEGQRDFIKYWLLNDNIVKSKKEVLNFLVKVEKDYNLTEKQIEVWNDNPPSKILNNNVDVTWSRRSRLIGITILINNWLIK